jgi:hypothetical protein
MTERERERQREYARRYYQRNRERWKRRYEEHREELNEWQKEYRKRNREHYENVRQSWRESRINPSVYLMTNTITGVRYVGSCLILKDRISEHKWELKTGAHPSQLMQQGYDEHGWESIAFTVLESSIDEDNLRNREAHWFDRLKPECNGIRPRVQGKENVPVGVRRSR